MRAKKHVVVLMGGMSAEHDVSLNSGALVMEHLDADTYKVSGVRITREGEWAFSGPEGEEEYLEMHDAVPRLKAIHPDCVFIALHGPFGEDGRIQGMLDLLGIPYTGSGCVASATAIEKIRAKALVSHAGIRVADHVEFTLREWEEDAGAIAGKVEEALGFPCVVKSPRQGSSLGMAIPKSAADFPGAVEEVLPYGFVVMAERFIEGPELTCAVLDVAEEDPPVALPVTEIRPVSSDYFDYDAKYTPGASEEITPAEIPDEVRDRVQAIAVRAHEVIGCRGFSRSDMILDGGDLVWLEINTIPGFTETSLYPQAAAAAGISFPEMLSLFVDAAML